MSDETQSYREHLRITGETAPTVISDESEEIDQLRARVAELEAENAALKRSAAMACEEPCGACAGCLYADDVHAREGAQGDDNGR